MFELSLPFKRIYVNHFIVKLKIADKESLENGYLTLQSLRNELKTPAWVDLENP